MKSNYDYEVFVPLQGELTHYAQLKAQLKYADAHLILLKLDSIMAKGRMICPSCYTQTTIGDGSAVHDVDLCKYCNKPYAVRVVYHAKGSPDVITTPLPE
jgi:hypothetical protein